jgi:hypothetical protein
MTFLGVGMALFYLSRAIRTAQLFEPFCLTSILPKTIAEKNTLSSIKITQANQTQNY